MDKELLKIINHYGIMTQLKYFQSEVFELNEAIITKTNRDKFNPFIGLINLSNKLNGTKDICIEHIVEEIADVQIMLNQFKVCYGIIDNEIEKIMKEKIKRQLERIENESN